jgi:DNA ligase (NAD+)
MAFQMPAKCPECGANVINDEEDPFTRCINSDCPAQLLKNIVHFVSRDAMDIDGLGQALIERFVNEGLIKSPADLYFLKRETLSVMERLGEKSADNLITAIENSKSNNLNRLIYAIGIRQVGQKAAKILAQRFGSMDKLKNASEEELISTEEVGPVTSHYIIKYFNTPKNIEFLQKLQEAGLNMIYTSSLSDNSLNGMTFVLTGTLSKFTRDEASAIIESKGGKISSSVSKKTAYLLAGEDAGSKYEKARSLNIKILSEDDFEEMIKK